MAQHLLCHTNTMKRRIFSFVLCIMMLLSMIPLVGAPEVHAATTSQNNIVARADYMYGLLWTCQQDVYGWNYNTLFSAGSRYRVPYGQPINSGYYVGYGVSIDTFMNAANTYGSVYYTSRSTYGSTSSVYYANDCSAFVSWCWGTSRYTTYSIPQVSTYIGMATAANAYSLQLGDALNSNDVGHVVLVTGLTYSGSTLTQIEITEQTPPQLKRSYYTPSTLGSKYGAYYSIQRYYGDVPASPGGNTNDDSGSSSSGSTTTGQYYPACDSSYESFYPAMESLGYSVSWELHQQIAAANGITDFTGTADQNTQLLNLLKAGRLINPNYSGGGSSSGGSSGSVQYYPACDASYESFYPAMESLGYSVDWTLHQEIAAANGITDFTGTADQNTQLLNLLKAGKLIIPGSGSSSGGSSSGGDVSDSVTDGKTGYDRGYAGGIAGTGTIYAKGLDVSGWQDITLDFSKIKAAGYDYVILRAGTTKGKDTHFETFYKNAKAAGLDVGAYYYSYALTVAEAKADADDFLSYIAGKTYEYPLYFDFEDPTQITLDYTLQKNICLAFMDKVAAEGYLTGMYTGKYHSTLLDMNTICAKYESWIAHYLRSDGDGTNDWTTYGYTYSTQFGMYQYTANCYVSGLSGYYDADLCYKDYPSIVKKYGFNGYTPEGSSSGSGDSGSTETGTYLDECTFYPSRVQIEVTEETYLSTEPRSAKDTNTAEKIETTSIGTVYKTTGIYCNTGGNMWYQVEASDGSTGYIYSKRVKYVKKLYDDIKISSYSLPEAHVKGNYFLVTGTISSTYNVITEARVYIYSGFGTSGTPVTGGSATISNNKYVLDGSTIDDATAFDSLSTGQYTYVITAPYYSYYADTNTTVAKVSSTRTIKKHYFTVVSSSVDQSTCSHSKQTTTVISAADCTTTGVSVTSCPTCGLTEKITTPKTHSYGSYTVTKAATCTTAGSKQRTCSKCGNVDTVTIAATGHSYNAATCTTAKTCKTCGATSGSALGHDYAAATCTKPKTCKTCGATSGSKLGHSYAAATCQKPKTCTRCGVTSGSTIDHIYVGSTCSMCGTPAGSANTGSQAGYLANCTFYPSHVQIKVTTGTHVYSEPRSATSTNTSKEMEAAEVGAVYDTIGMYSNTGGNMWYQVKTSDGSIGYIYSGRVEFVKKLYDDIKLTNYDKPNAHVAGTAFDVTGIITSDYTTITEARVYIYSGFGTDGTRISYQNDEIINNYYALANSPVATATSFKDLPVGQYTYVIIARNNCYYASDTKTAKLVNSARTLLKHYFTVVSSSVDQDTCSHSKQTTTVMTPATCTTTGVSMTSCPTCGLTTKVTTAKIGHNYSAATCTAPKTCTVCGATSGSTLSHNYADATCTKPKTCTVCGATSGSALGHKYSNADCSAPATCTVCGVSTGSALGHEYSAPTCDSPSTCIRCGAFPEGVIPRPSTSILLGGTDAYITSNGASIYLNHELRGYGLWIVKQTENDAYGNTGIASDTILSAAYNGASVAPYFGGTARYHHTWFYKGIGPVLNDDGTVNNVKNGAYWTATAEQDTAGLLIKMLRLSGDTAFGSSKSNTHIEAFADDTFLIYYIDGSNYNVLSMNSDGTWGYQALTADQVKANLANLKIRLYRYSSDTGNRTLNMVGMQAYTVPVGTDANNIVNYISGKLSVVDTGLNGIEVSCSGTSGKIGYYWLDGSVSASSAGNKTITIKYRNDDGTDTVIGTVTLRVAANATLSASNYTSGTNAVETATKNFVFTKVAGSDGPRFNNRYLIVHDATNQIMSYDPLALEPGTALGHDYTDATCSSPMTCKRCGATSGSALGHSYTEATCTAPKTCTICGATSGTKLGHSYTAATCTTPKTCTRCGTSTGAALGHDWTDATCTTAKTCATCGITSGEANGHDWAAATCTNAKTCYSCGATSGTALGHSYTDGVCVRCGEKSPYITVYFENNWKWSDVSVHYWGSSVIADTNWPGNAMTYVETDSYGYDIYSAQVPADATGIIFNGIKDDGSGNLDQTPNITDISTDVCYYMTWEDGNSYNSFPYPITSAITQKGRNLSYEDLIYVIDVFELTGVEGVDLTTDAGLLIWSVEEFQALSEIAFDADHANVGLTPYQDTAYYCGVSDGIFTRDLHEEAYYVGYVKMPNGSYIYSEAKLYSPAIYATTMLGKSTTSASTKELCVALLNYISAAQVYFHGTAEADLVNYELTDDQKALSWDNVSLNLAPTVPTNKQVTKDSAVFTGTGKNLLFEEMISMAAVYKIDDNTIADAQSCGTIFWTADQFAQLSGAPSIDNYGSGTKTDMSQYRNTAGQWCSYAPALAAKEMADTQYYYLGYVVHSDGTVSYSGVMSYTVEQYINNTVSNSSTSDAMLVFAQRLYYYERAAKLALGGN